MASPLDKVTWPVVTERLRIRPATADDVESTWAFRRLPEVTEWMTSRAATLKEYSELFLASERLLSTLVVQRGGEVVGDLMLRVEDAWSQTEVRDRAKNVQAELGWCIAPSYAGQGLATEAVVAMIGLCFGQLGLRRVTANCFADNVASWRLMERIGMRREQHLVRESLHRSGAWLDGYGYALLAEEWPVP